MLSDKAIEKSINNGFSREEHLKAVYEIKSLFENSKLMATNNDKSRDENILIHRFNSDFMDANALITTKESLDKNKNRIYSVELELTPRFSESTRPTNAESSEGILNSQKAIGEPLKSDATIAKEAEIIPQTPLFYAEPKFKQPIFTNGAEKSQKETKEFNEFLEKVLKRNPLIQDIDKEAIEKDLRQKFKQFDLNGVKELVIKHYKFVITEAKEEANANALKILKTLFNTTNSDKSTSEAILKQQLERLKSNKTAKFEKQQFPKLQEAILKNPINAEMLKKRARLNLELIFNFKPIKEYGENLAEYYHQPYEAAREINYTKKGQIVGAFYREELGDIDLIFQRIKIKDSDEFLELMQKGEILRGANGVQIKGDEGEVDLIFNNKSKRWEIDKVTLTEAEMQDITIKATKPKHLKFLQEKEFLKDLFNQNKKLDSYTRKENYKILNKIKNLDLTELNFSTNEQLGQLISKLKELETDALDNAYHAHYYIVEKELKKTRVYKELEKELKGKMLENYNGIKSLFDKKELSEKEEEVIKDAFYPDEIYKNEKDKIRLAWLFYPSNIFYDIDKLKEFILKKVVNKADSSIKDSSKAIKENVTKESTRELKEAVEATPSATADKIIQQLKQDINVDLLNKTQREVYEVFIGKRESTFIKGKDESDLYTLEKGSRKAGARKIIIKHAGLEKTGGLSNKELLEMDKVIKDGEILKDSFELRDNAIRYAYGLEKDGVKFRLVVDEYNDGKKIFDYYSDRNFINYSDSTILQTNTHLGSGLLSGSVAGIESDEEGNISINPQAFLAGLIGGSVGSKGVASAYQRAKLKYYEKHFNKLIDEVNKNKGGAAKFEVTKELEKKYRENRINAKNSVIEKLNLKGGIYADFIKLAQKHPEYFKNPQAAKMLTSYILENAKVGIKASKDSYELIFAELKGGKGALALDLELKGGKHRVRSVYLMKNSQYKFKLFNAKKQGEPILQF